ncbi:MAG: carboxylesterase/lipase family protein [Acidimicrobiia bacterium]
MTATSHDPRASPIAAPPCGAVRGLRRDGADVFMGIRFASVERFAPPLPVAPWDGELDATAYGAQCHQIPGLLEKALGGSSLPMAEDCLSLNIATPRCDDGRRPVLVWVHGGAFVTGTGSMPWYEGSSLATRGDVVVVTINYRLGAFGFTGAGNQGLRDQLAALDWVQRNIAAFGGDPGSVTVFGESAGGASVVALLATPAVGATFHRAWAMSASITQLRDERRAAEATAALLAAAELDDVAALLALSADRLLHAQRAVLRDRAGAMTAFSPAPDGDVLTGSISDAASRAPIPVVLGSTRDEMQLFNAFDHRLADLTDNGLRTEFERRLGARTTEAIATYRALRPGATNGQLASAVQTDETFRVPARRLAEARAEQAAPTWMYWFTWASPAFGGALGSCHGLDIPFAFHNLEQPGVAAFTGERPERVRVADVFSDALIAFARNGDPGWPAYDTSSRATLQIDAESRVLDDPEGDLRELWDARA